MKDPLVRVQEKINGKSILIWGFGREGQSTKRFLERCCKPAQIEVFEGKREDIDEAAYDYIFKSPGIVMEEENPKYTSQTEVFLEGHRDRVIGITGTKGKSTTSSMMFHVLSDCLDKKVILLGNIGEPCLDYYDEVNEDTVVVFEMSCHQLAHTKVSPHVAVFLNLFEEHLDYYKTMDKYFAAKRNVTFYQQENDFFFVGDNVPTIETKAHKEVIRRADAPEYELKVLGEHNSYNAHYAFRIATEIYGAAPEKVRESLKTFDGLAHRLQYIGEKDGIRYYDDSISTIPNAAIEALKAIPEAYTIFLGGMDRGICYDALLAFVREHGEYYYIFSYDSGRRMYESVSDLENCTYVATLEEAVAVAKQVTPKGRACVLSPASASYGYFKNFEHRGEMFKEYVGL